VPDNDLATSTSRWICYNGDNRGCEPTLIESPPDSYVHSPGVGLLFVVEQANYCTTSSPRSGNDYVLTTVAMRNLVGPRKTMAARSSKRRPRSTGISGPAAATSNTISAQRRHLMMGLRAGEQNPLALRPTRPLGVPSRYWVVTAGQLPRAQVPPYPGDLSATLMNRQTAPSGCEKVAMPIRGINN